MAIHFWPIHCRQHRGQVEDSHHSLLNMENEQPLRTNTRVYHRIQMEVCGGRAEERRHSMLEFSTIK